MRASDHVVNQCPLATLDLDRNALESLVSLIREQLDQRRVALPTLDD